MIGKLPHYKINEVIIGREINRWANIFIYLHISFVFLGLIMVLAGASEFDPQYNKDATSRPTDNILIPQVRPISEIP